MSINTTTYIRNPLYVEAVQVTRENFTELALWCQGEIIEVPSDPSGKQWEPYIQVRVTNPMNPRQAQARIGDWILTSDRGYKIYTPKAFANSFYLAPATPAKAVHETRGARQLFQEDTPAGELEDRAPVGSGPMPPQPMPTDVEMQRPPALPENLKDENIVYPPGHTYSTSTIHPGIEPDDDGT